uniref:Translin-associated protein X n=1 Tax=Syphacia muris TaxID=451379 RepID=A0A0N5AGJ1_9BILA
MRHDRHEQIVKCSRDITSESKKIIFLLHRYSGKKTDEEKREILEEAKERLNEVRSSLLLKVAKAMSCVMDQYMHNSAITFGIQEHIEASAFFKFISTGQLLMYDEMKELFTFAENDPDGDLKEYSLEITPLDYLLGLSDVGGELMRYATNQYSAGDISTAENVVDFMRVIYRGYLLHHSQHRDFTQKTVIFRQSLMKVLFYFGDVLQLSI